MKVKIEDFLLAMGDYCKEHDVDECCPENCKLSVDHDDPGNGLCLDAIIQNTLRW